MLYQEAIQCGDGIQFSHTIEEQVGGLLQAGFRLTHLYEDTNGEGNLHEHGIPTFWRCGLQKRSKFGQTRERHTWRKILLLEDEESVNRGIEFTLKKEGYEVENAGTIREAWELFQKQEPKLMSAM